MDIILQGPIIWRQVYNGEIIITLLNGLFLGWQLPKRLSNSLYRSLWDQLQAGELTEF